MVLSEAEAETRLAALRREREALDRAIADLTLYLELGRRLTDGALAPVPTGVAASPHDTARVSASPPSIRTPAPAPPPAAVREASQRAATPPGDRAGAAGLSGAAEAGSENAEPPETKSAEAIPEGALARRYGRALIREAVAVLEAAGRPLHASEILSALAARGFTVPGQQDPVAALNTRLWKRSTPGGPLRRLGDAIYALAPIESDEAGLPD